jgi:hypothetical protein
MKDWSGTNICFECAKKLGANINIGRQLKGRCHRCHSEQTLFKVTDVPTTPLATDEVCPECAHPLGTHANSCRRSELEILRQELQEIVSVLKEAECYDPEKSLADQLRQALRRGKDDQSRS